MNLKKAAQLLSLIPTLRLLLMKQKNADFGELLLLSKLQQGRQMPTLGAAAFG